MSIPQPSLTHDGTEPAKVVRIERIRPHPGQVRVIAEAQRFNVLRCGRRWGKTTLGERLITETLRFGQPVGWFSGTYKVLGEAWRDTVRLLAPITTHISVQDHRIAIHGGGSVEFWSLEGGDDPGRGRKYARAIIDEAGLPRNLKAAWLGAIRPTLVDYHGDAWFLGTPDEDGPYFNDLYNLGQSGVAGWVSWQLPSTDNPYIDAESEIEDARRAGMPDWMIRREFYGEPSETDTGFFSKRIVENHRAINARDPIAIGTLGVATADTFERESIVSNRKPGSIRWRNDPSGSWSWWEWWDGDRPNQEFAYCIGVDLGYGVGSSNTVFSVMNADTRVYIAKFVSPSVTPEEAAVLAGMLSIWIGGRTRSASICPESNGPGEVFIKHARRLHLNLYQEVSAPSDADNTTPDRFGWRSGPTSKEILLGDYRSAMASGRVVNPCGKSLSECLTYRVDEKGRVVSQYEWAGDDATEGARVPHGDRVIADALAWLGCQQIGRLKPPEMPVIPGTLSAVLKKKHDARLAKDRW